MIHDMIHTRRLRAGSTDRGGCDEILYGILVMDDGKSEFSSTVVSRTGTYLPLARMGVAP